MKSIDDYLGWDIPKIAEGIYECPVSEWWRFTSYSDDVIELGLCDSPVDLEIDWPTSTAVMELLDLDIDAVNIAEYDIYRGSYSLDEQPRYIYRYMIL